MKISIKKVKTIADAAKINIENDEIQVYATQLNAIQEMMDGIVELDIDPKIPPMLYISSDKMTLRQDECIEFEDVSSLETNTDFDDKNYIVVPKVM